MLSTSICGMYPNQTPIMPNKEGSSPCSLREMKLTTILRYTDQNRENEFFCQGCKEINVTDFKMGSMIALDLAYAASETIQTMKNSSNSFPSSRMTRTPKSSTSQPNSIPVEKSDFADLEWTDHIPECPVYHPSETEFEDPFTYLETIAPEASKYGICKIVSPFKASVPATDVLGCYKFSTFLQPLQLAGGDGNDMVTFTIQKRKYTLATFRKKANKANARQLPHYRELSPSDVEKNFWQEISRGKRTVEYASNVEGSAFSCDPHDQLGRSKWNFKVLPKLPESILRLIKDEIPGVTYPMLYIGMLYSTFAWHVEDHYLNSINYHHTGAPKTWYGVPGNEAILLEKVTMNHVYSRGNISTDGEDGAFKTLAKKTTMFSPSILMKNGVDVYRTLQKPGEFVVTFPRAYHAGFSHGFNCGEAVNFAIGNWFPFGAAATKRYACLSMRGIIPHEELLCKEALLLLKSLKDDRFDCATAELVFDESTKNSFIQHMHWFNNALQRVKNDVKYRTASTRHLPRSHGSVICGLCQRSSYLAFIKCSNCHSLTCLFHEIQSLHCRCGKKCILCLRVDINDVGDALEKFEGEGRLQEDHQEIDCAISTCEATTYPKEVAPLPGIDKRNIELSMEKTSETVFNKFSRLTYSRRSKRAKKKLY